MPYKSDKQRRFMHAQHPKIAARWDREYGGKVEGKKKRRRLTDLAPERKGEG